MIITGYNPNRYYTAVSNTNHATPIYNYVWSPYAVGVGSNSVITGVMVAVGTNTFQPFITGFNNAQFQIPIQAKDFSIWTVSGTSFINGTPFFAGQLYQGGQYDGNQTLASPVNVGVTGGWVTIAYEI